MESAIPIALRCLYYKPVTPNFLIIELPHELWQQFLWGDRLARIKIIYPYLPPYHPMVREIAWIPLIGLSESDKSLLINKLNNSDTI